MAKKNSKCYLLAWDMYGLESVVPVSEIEAAMDAAEKQRIVDILSDPNLADRGDSSGRTLNQLMNGLILRAKFNTQRCYEIYTIHVDSSIDEQTLRNMFEESPQASAELIRKRGNKIYSDRSTQKQLIT